MKQIYKYQNVIKIVPSTSSAAVTTVTIRMVMVNAENKPPRPTAE